MNRPFTPVHGVHDVHLFILLKMFICSNREHSVNTEKFFEHQKIRLNFDPFYMGERVR